MLPRARISGIYILRCPPCGDTPIRSLQIRIQSRFEAIALRGGTPQFHLCRYGHNRRSRPPHCGKCAIQFSRIRARSPFGAARLAVTPPDSIPAATGTGAVRSRPPLVPQPEAAVASGCDSQKLYTNIFFRPLKDKISGVADDRPAKHFPSLPFQGFVRLPDRIGALPAKSPSPLRGFPRLSGRRLSRKSAETAVFSPNCAGDV